MPEISTVELPSQSTRVQTGGSGPPLLFLHSEANTSKWGEFHDLLAADFSVTAPVHPGFGGEDTPDWLEDISDLVFHYVDLIEALGLDQPLVVGSSLGGWIAADLAIHRSDLISGAVLAGPLGLRPANPIPDIFIMELGDAVGHLSNTLDQTQVNPMTGDAELATQMWVELATQAGGAGGPHSSFRQFINFDFWRSRFSLWSSRVHKLCTHHSGHQTPHPAHPLWAISSSQRQ